MLKTATQNGFTLIEMIVVLTLVGLMAAVAVPSISRQLGERTKQSELELIMSEIGALPAQAMLQGKRITLPEVMQGPQQGPLHLPDQWTVAFSPALTVSSVPACSPSTITLSYANKDVPEAVYQIESVTCQLKAVHAGYAR